MTATAPKLITGSVTNIETYRQYVSGYEWGPQDPDALLRQLRHEDPPSAAMHVGTAVHEALERAQPGDVLDHLAVDGLPPIEFTPPLELGEGLPFIREASICHEVDVDGEPFRVTGRVDVWEPRCVTDYKVTAKPDPEMLEAGIQWKIYLLMTGEPCFAWQVMRRKDRQKSKVVIKYEIDPPVAFTQYRYPGMEDECLRWVREYARFVRKVNEEARA